MTKLAVMEATAKAMPCAPSIMAVLTPITSPTEEIRVTTGLTARTDPISIRLDRHVTMR
ncbi:MAG: hypothetical protein J0I08_02785 [Rhizobiales bacterium]|nr:hypothetical protein [Hyphomicrobiales bacterium]